MFHPVSNCNLDLEVIEATNALNKNDTSMAHL